MAQEFTKLTINANNQITSVNEQLPPLGDDDVRVQVLSSNINKSDLTMWQTKNNNDFFGTEIVGKVTATGKNVGHCKVGQTVGVHREKNNFRQFTTGFANHLQVHQESILYIPDTIQREQAGLFLGSGATAFNAIQKVIPGSSIAVVGSGHLAYLMTQFAIKMSGCKVTLFDYEGNEQLAKQFGADNFVALSKVSIEKHIEKFKTVIITENIKEDEAFCIQDMAWRSGHIIFAIALGYYPKIHTLDFMTGQKTYLGARRGSYGQAVKALKAAAYYNIRGKVDVFEAAKYQAAFQKAKASKVSHSIALKY